MLVIYIVLNKHRTTVIEISLCVINEILCLLGKKYTNLIPRVGSARRVCQNNNQLSLGQEGLSSLWGQRVSKVGGTLLKEEGRRGRRGGREGRIGGG